MTLHQFLLNIQQGKPVNFAQLCKKLPKNIVWQSLFTLEPVGQNKHIVAVIDTLAFTTLLQKSKLPNTRKNAAVHTSLSSHNVKCSSAYMLCFPADITGLSKSYLKQAPRILTAVALINEKLLPLPFNAARTAILIENQDCFFEWQRLLTHFAEQIDLRESDIYFSAGSRILNRSFANLLSRYEYIDCAFDYDLAGLETSVLLSERKYASVQFLVPESLSKYHDLFTFKPNSTKEAADMIGLCKHFEMVKLATAISETKCFMEQEALLTIV